MQVLFNHPSNSTAPLCGRKKLAAKFHRLKVRNVLMLRNGIDFRFLQSRIVHAFFESQHLAEPSIGRDFASNAIDVRDATIMRAAHSSAHYLWECGRAYEFRLVTILPSLRTVRRVRALSRRLTAGPAARHPALMGPILLYPFRYRDPLIGKWVRAPYVAERHEIAEHYCDPRN
jgi:hypothetical protein